MPTDDIVAVEWRRRQEIIVSLPGTYSLASKRDLRGALRLFACRAIGVSPDAVALAAPVQSWVGDRAAVEVEHFGRLQGTVAHLLRQHGFVVDIIATPEERRKLADKIEWIERFKNLEVCDQRSESRFAPRSPSSILVLADGSCIPCFIIDLSISGAAVSADIAPKIGVVLAVGRIVGRVVRHFSGGFSVAFVRKQARQSVEALATRRY
jgi:hypothetical protein